MIMLDMNLCHNEICYKGTTLHFDIYEGIKFSCSCDLCRKMLYNLGT